MVASVYGQSAVVSVLVEYGATVDLQDDVSIVNIKRSDFISSMVKGDLCHVTICRWL